MKNSRGIKLLVFDMDGTALGGHVPYEQFPKPFVKLLHELAKAGISWATNTTWSTAGQMPVIAASGLKAKPAFLTGATGLQFATVQRGKFVPDKAHDEKIKRREARFRKKNWPLIKSVLTTLVKEDLAERLVYNFWRQSTMELSWKKGVAARAWQVVGPLLDSGEYYSFSSDRKGTTATLLPKFMNKGEPMKELHRRLKIGPENIIVAGDGSNDLHMFEPRLAKWMVCPANASPLVKKKVLRFGGIVARKKFSWGVIEGVRKILAS